MWLSAHRRGEQMFGPFAADMTKGRLLSSSATEFEKHCEWILMAVNIALSFVETALGHK